MPESTAERELNGMIRARSVLGHSGLDEHHKSDWETALSAVDEQNVQEFWQECLDSLTPEQRAELEEGQPKPEDDND